jgi:hypothetical protein
MEVKMQTSFIPKKPIIESHSRGSGISLFLLLSIIIFIVSVSLAGGIWLWRNSLVAKIEKDKAALVAAKESYEEDTINPLIRLNDRIEETKGLLSRHLAVSPVFLMLEKNILRNVRLKSMNFSYGGSDKINVSLSGLASSYDALSKQSDAFGDESLRKFISEPVISGFSPTADGSISFTFSASINPKLVSYTNTQTGENNLLDNTEGTATTQ